MARFPKIDSPCPLNRDEQRRIDGYCRRCDKTVHALDAMNDAERAAFMAAQGGPVCVSWRAPRRNAGPWPLAMAASLIAGTALAQAPATVDTAAPVPTATPQPDVPMSLDEDMIVFVGGVDDPADAAWIDDESLPEIPTVVEAVLPKPR